MLARRENPSFCIIAPTSYCESYASQSSTHLCLAHLVDNDPTYAAFYRTMAQRPNDYIMMDCSAFELGESYDPGRLIDLANECGADAIVLPDYPLQIAEKTIDAAKEHIPTFKAAGFNTFFVPQSKRGCLEEWIESYIWAAHNPDVDIIGMSILGIPNALPHIPAAYARVVMTQILIDRGVFNFDKFHHYLGLNSGPALEIPALLQMNALDTCDSSGPVWSGILGHKYDTNADSFLAVGKPKMHVDFAHQLTTDINTLNRIQHNLDLTLGLFN